MQKVVQVCFLNIQFCVNLCTHFQTCQQSKDKNSENTGLPCQGSLCKSYQLVVRGGVVRDGVVRDGVVRGIYPLFSYNILPFEFVFGIFVYNFYPYN